MANIATDFPVDKFLKDPVKFITTKKDTVSRHTIKYGVSKPVLRRKLDAMTYREMATMIQMLYKVAKAVRAEQHSFKAKVAVINQKTRIFQHDIEHC